MSNTSQITDQDGVTFDNQKLIDYLSSAPNGEVKEASAAGSKMIRRKIRENAFSRSIIPPQPITNAQLDRALNTNLPFVIDEMEPKSPGAKAISFNDTTDTAFYDVERFATYFETITTKEFTKNVDELRTVRSDLRAVTTDNSLKEVQRTEDSGFIKGIDRLVGPEGGVGPFSGRQQNFVINGPISRETYPDILKLLEAFELNNGVALMNRSTAKEFLKFPRSEIGGDLSEEMFKDGLSAIKEAKLFGVRHLFTIKQDLVPDNVVYLFTEPDYLGVWYQLEDITMYVEKKEDILRFKAKEKLGVSIANVLGVVRVRFDPTA